MKQAAGDTTSRGVAAFAVVPAHLWWDPLVLWAVTAGWLVRSCWRGWDCLFGFCRRFYYCIRQNEKFLKEINRYLKQKGRGKDRDAREVFAPERSIQCSLCAANLKVIKPRVSRRAALGS